MHGFYIGLILFFNLLLLVFCGFVLHTSHKHRVRLRRQRDVLLQEKEATLGFVHNVGEVFAESDNIDMDTLLARVLHYAVRTCKAGSGAIHLVNTKASRLEARAVSGVFPPPFETEAALIELEHGTTESLGKMVRNTPVPLGKGLIGETAVLGNSTLVEDAEIDARIPHFKSDFLKIRTLLVVPMRFGKHTIGVMSLVNRTDGGRFALPDLNLAQALAAQASVPIHYAGLQEALEEKRQLDRDMQIAQQIQNSLLPQELPSYPSVELAAFNLPAMEIGGDYYDCIQIDDRHIGLAIADVSGKGVGGALMMAVCRSVLRMNAPNVFDPAAMLCTLNETLASNLAEDMFISMLYMVLNLETHQLSIARAGHEAPILVRQGETCAERIESPGMVIGLVDNSIFEGAVQTRNVSLRPGDLLVTYTDGITEAMNSDEEEWGVENLVQSVERMAGSSAHDLLDQIRQEVLDFAGKNRQYDDMTMLALKIR
jgi:sigma-B regulation protein RsbU (phosphoserine phosphatase)